MPIDKEYTSTQNEPTTEFNYDRMSEEFEAMENYIDFLEHKIRLDDMFKEVMILRSEGSSYQSIMEFMNSWH